MEPARSLSPQSPTTGATWHALVTDFKRRLLEQALTNAGGNRTHAARALGLQRTYLLRLIREFRVPVPPPRRSNGKAADHGPVAGSIVPPGTNGNVREPAKPDMIAMAALGGNRYVGPPASASVVG